MFLKFGNFELVTGREAGLVRAKALKGTTSKRADAGDDDEQQSFGGLTLSDVLRGNQAPSARSLTKRDIDIIFSYHVWTRAAVEIVARDLGQHQFVVKIEDEDRQEDPVLMEKRSRISTLLSNPNFLDGGNDLTQMLAIDLQLVRVATLEVTHWVATGEPAELFPVKPTTIRVNINGRGEISNPQEAFTQMCNGVPGESFSLDEMIFIRYTPRSGQVIPETPLQTLQQAIWQDGLACKLNLDTLRNGNESKYLIMLAEEGGVGLDPEDVARIQQEWDAKHRGKSKSRISFISGAKPEAVRLDNTMSDQEWTNLERSVVRKVSTIFGVPMFYLGWPDETKFSNAEFGEKGYVQRTLLPLALTIADKYNQFLVPQFGVSSDEIKVYPPDTLRQQTDLDLRRETKDQSTGVITVNDVRRARGLKPFDWGDDYLYNPTGGVFVPFPGKEPLPVDVSDEEEPPPPEKPTAGKPPAPKPPATKPPATEPAARTMQKRFRQIQTQRSSAWRAGVNTFKSRLLRAYIKVVRQLAATMKRVPDRLIESAKPDLDREPMENPAVGAYKQKAVDWIDDLLDSGDWEAIEAACERGVEAGVVFGVAESEAFLGRYITGFRVEPTAILAQVEGQALRVSDPVRFATQGTARNIIYDGIRTGKTAGEIARDLQTGILGESMRGDGRIVFHDGTDGQRAFSMTPENWSEVTAQTEYTRAANTARLESWKEAGVQKKQWFTMDDERVRDEHLANAAEGAIPIDQPFGNGEMMPGEAPNCRCWAEVSEGDLNRLAGEGEE